MNNLSCNHKLEEYKVYKNYIYIKNNNNNNNIL